MISLKQINYALAVEKTLHFKKASELCHVSQSALSSAINEMESQLGLQIFERNNKNVFVTCYGQKVLDKAKRIKLEMDELVQLSQLKNSPLCTPMKLGIIPTIGPYLLPKVLPCVRSEFPQFQLKIVEAQSRELVDMVKSGDLDTAIIALPFSTDGLMSLEFWQEDFYWVGHKDEGSSQLQEITTNEMELDRLMLLKEGHCLKEHALVACQHKERQVDSDFNATSLHTIIQMVAGKMGTTFVPEMALEQLLHNENDLRAVHLNEPGPHRTIAFIFRPNYIKTNDIEVLKELFKNELRELSEVG